MRAFLVNGSIWGADADSLIISKGLIVKVGYESSLADYSMSEGLRKVDLQGSSVVPPLHDSHTHIPTLGPNTVDLRGVRSIKELKERLRRLVRGGKRLIYGRGWDHTLFKEGRYPTLDDVDPFTKGVPLVLVRVCGHVALLNTRSIQLLRDRFGDKINEYLIMEDGRPTGLIVEEGIKYAMSLIPKPSLNELKNYVIAYLSDYIRLGVLYLNIMSVDDYLLNVLEGLSIKGLRNLGVYLSQEAAMMVLQGGMKIGRIRVCGIKCFADGSFGGRTARLRNGYRDGGYGKLLLGGEARFRELLSLSSSFGGQLAVHAIGDEAIETVINYALKVGMDGDRLRVEHASLAPPDIIHGLSSLKPYVVVQPHFLVSDWWLGEALRTEDLRWVYPYKSLMDEGIQLYGSSDYPVEPKNPYLGISSAITRGMLQRYTYEESLSKDVAINMYLGDPCFGRSEIREGGEADLVVLDKNINALHGYDIAAVKPKLVLSSGEIIYKSNDL